LPREYIPIVGGIVQIRTEIVPAQRSDPRGLLYFCYFSHRACAQGL